MNPSPRRHVPSFAITPPKPAICPAASAFQTWLGQYLETLGTTPTPAQLILAKADVTDRYLEYWSAAPKDCKYRATTKGHTCILHIFLQAQLALRTIGLQMPSRSLGLKPAKTDAFPSEVFIGVIEGEEDAAQ